MASFNKVILMGNLTRDPELRVTPKGASICQIGLAINSSFTDKEGNKREEVTFVDVDCFGKTAETVAKYFAKGRPILLEGRLKLDSWETKEGEKRSKLKVAMDSFTFVGSRDDQNSAPQAAPARGRQQSAPQQSSSKIDLDDVPF